MASSYSLGQHYEAFVKDMIASGRYSTASEVLRDGLRLIEEREEQRVARLEALRQAVREGVESGPGVPAEQVFNRLEAKYRGESRG